MTLPDELIEAVRLALLGLRKKRIKAIVDDPDRAFSDHEQTTESCEADADIAISAFLEWCEREGIKLTMRESDALIASLTITEQPNNHLGDERLRGQRGIWAAWVDIWRKIHDAAPPHPWGNDREAADAETAALGEGFINAMAGEDKG